MRTAISHILYVAKHGNRNDLYLVAIACLVLVVALSIRAHIPAAVWSLLIVAIPFYNCWIIASLDKKTRFLLGGVCFSAFLTTVAVAYICGLKNPELNLSSLDDATYLRQARAIAQEWKLGHFPPLSAKGSALYYLGSLHTGYQRLLAAVFYLFGADYRWGIWLNFLASALIPTFIYWAVYLLLHQRSTREVATRAGLRGAWMAAIYPSFGYWASWLLKDVVLATIFVASLAAALDTIVRRRVLALLFLSAGLCALFLFRAYAGWALVAGLVGYGLSIIPRRLVLASFVTLLGAAVLFSYTETGGFYIRQLGYSLAELIPSNVLTLPRSLIYFCTSIPRLILSPYAWVRARVEEPMYALYPGMWWLYALVYPLALAGLYHLARLDVRPATIPLVAWAASAAILIIAYGGNAPRQRLYLDSIMIVFAACGSLGRQRWQFFGLWFVLLSVYITIHLVTLDLRLGTYGR
ncbi:MAG: hypothetical protein N2Z21_04965 [Candidatus Sumerlaeaceae bacterium]|nr:hypothetical protein [Candidatus Sumerlaeaceae bacterium]